MATSPSAPNYTPPAGTSYDAGPSAFQYAPQMPGIQTSPPAVTTPSVPNTTVAATNTTGVDVIAYITAGSGCTLSAVSVNGTATGLAAAASTSLTVYLPAQQTITLTYSGGSVTWVWLAA